jgi:Uma2 family endonuclease
MTVPINVAEKPIQATPTETPPPVETTTPEEEKFVTIEEFWEIVHRPENEGKKLELVNGVVVEEIRTTTMGGAGARHGSICGVIFGVFWEHVRPNKLGRLFGAETGFQFGIKPNGKPFVRCPDMAFVRQERLVLPIPVEYMPYPPDIAIEVLSPGNTAQQIHDKVRDYLKNGVAIVWVVYPNSESVVVHTTEGSKEYEGEDMLDGGEILPEFRLMVKDIFAED